MQLFGGDNISGNRLEPRPSRRDDCSRILGKKVNCIS